MGRVELEVAAILPRCRDCRWWQGDGIDPGTRICQRINTEGADGQPYLVPIMSRLRRNISVTARLETSANFGCVQWQAKE